MPKGVPSAGFRMTKNRMKNGLPHGKTFAAPKTQQIVLKPAFVEPVKVETDDEIRTKLKDAFSTMDKIAEATIMGVNKAFILSGPPGLGKSYGVMKIAERLEKNGRKVTIVKGFARATGVYKVLYEGRGANCVTIFDDADSVFWDLDAVNLLKSACDMTRKRRIDWRAESNMETEAGERLPNSFDYEGSILFLTNLDFDNLIEKTNKHTEHFKAMISRSIYLKMPIESRRDYMMRITMVIEEGMLRELGLSEFDSNELMMFIDKNCENLRELSLRMVLKVANLMRIDRNRWQVLAKTSCFTKRT